MDLHCVVSSMAETRDRSQTRGITFRTKGVVINAIYLRERHRVISQLETSTLHHDSAQASKPLRTRGNLGTVRTLRSPSLLGSRLAYF